MEFLETLLLLIGGFIAFSFVAIIVGSWAQNKTEEISLQKKEYEIYVRVENHVLLVEQCNTKWIKEIKIEQISNTSLKYVPERYIFTSATVGGITTGGVEKVGGYNRARTFKSDRYKLKYFGEDIEYIQLTESLYDFAVTSAIQKYLNDKKQIIIADKERESSIFQNLLLKGYNLNTGTSDGIATFQAVQNECLPTYEKCTEIINWLYSACNLNAASSAPSSEASLTSYSCPTCGYPIAFGATKCNSCGQDIVWQ